MVEAISMFGWTFIMIVLIAIITSITGEKLDD